MRWRTCDCALAACLGDAQRRPSFDTVSTRILVLDFPDHLYHLHPGRLESGSGLVDPLSRYGKVSPPELLISMRALLETFLHAIRVRVAPRKRWSRKRESDYALGTLQTTRFAVVTADGRQGLSLRSYIHPTQSFPKRLLTDVTTYQLRQLTVSGLVLESSNTRSSR